MIRLPTLSRLVTAARAKVPTFTGSHLRSIAIQPNSSSLYVPPAVLTCKYGNTDAKGAWAKKAHAAAVFGAIALYGGSCGNANQHSCCDDGGKAGAIEKKPEPTLTQKLIAEACGTGIIVLGGCGCVAAKVYCNSGLAIGAAAATWGMSVALAAYTTRDISGAHLNPAVTASLAVNKDFPKEHVIPYWFAQVFGAAVAGAFNFITFFTAIAAFEAEKAIVRGAVGSSASFNGAFGMIPNAACVSTVGAFIIEIFSTAALLYLIFSITDPKGTVPDAAGPALVGVTVAVLLATFAPLTGCGLNPARDLGPRLVTLYAGWGKEALHSWWVYTFGPLIGGVLGGAAYQASCAK